MVGGMDLFYLLVVLIAIYAAGVALTYSIILTALDYSVDDGPTAPRSETRSRARVLAVIWPGTLAALVLAMAYPPFRRWLLTGRSSA